MSAGSTAFLLATEKDILYYKVGDGEPWVCAFASALGALLTLFSFPSNESLVRAASASPCLSVCPRTRRGTHLAAPAHATARCPLPARLTRSSTR